MRPLLSKFPLSKTASSPLSKHALARSTRAPILNFSHPATSHSLRRSFSSRPSLLQQNQYNTPPPQNYSFYRTHGRAFFKTFTLAFLTYQIVYWFWLTIEAEEIRDAKDAEIKSLESEVRLLDEGRNDHKLLREKRRVHRGHVDSEGDVDEWQEED